MLGITTFGLTHTAISLLALVAGVGALARHGAIGMDSRSGKAFVLLTVVSCVTGLFIFHHGGFGKPHVLALLTLAILAIAYIAEKRAASRQVVSYVSVVGYSLAFFFHFIPGFTETLTRLPQPQPWASSPDDPKLAALIGVFFVLFLLGAGTQVFFIRAKRRRVHWSTGQLG